MSAFLSRKRYFYYYKGGCKLTGLELTFSFIGFDVVWRYMIDSVKNVVGLVSNFFGLFPQWVLNLYGLGVCIIVILGVIRVVGR